MEKALEKIKEIIDFCDAVGCHRAIYESIKFVEKELEEAMKPKTCQECKHWDRTRPRSHPNYAECNNRNCPISYEEVIYTFGCNRYEPKDTQC